MGLFCRDGACCTTACDRPCEACGGGGVCNGALASDPQRCGAVTCTTAANACRTITPPAAGQCSGLGQCAGNAANSQCTSNQCVLHFADADDDEFAVVGATQTSFCVDGSFDVFQFTTRQPLGLSTTDCQEGNANVFPGQTRSFTTAAVGKTTLPFDYNCDGSQSSPTVQRNSLQDCTNTAIASCSARASWILDSSTAGAIGVPACGGTGYISACGERGAGGPCESAAGGLSARDCN